MDKKLRSRPQGVVLLGFCLVAAFCLAPVEELTVSVQVGGAAWACGGYMSLPDPLCDDPDTDGDGIPDSQDPCPNEPDPNCELVIAEGDRSDLPPVECSDGTRVTDVQDCPNYDAISGNGGSGETEDDADRGEGRGGGGGGNRSKGKGVGMEFSEPDDRTRQYEPTARDIDACVHQGHADFQGITYSLEFKKITRARDGRRAMGAANASSGTTYLDLEEIFRGNGRGFGGSGWKLVSAQTSVHEIIHHLHPDWSENRVRRESKKSKYARVADRCARKN